MKFSVFSIVYNEERRLAKSLEIFKEYTDDIIIFDTESTDNTYEIAKSFTNRVYKVPYVGYCDGYEDSALLRSKYDWGLHLSPDEEWSKESLNAIAGLYNYIPYDAIAIKRKEIIEGIEQPGFSGWHYRVFRKHNVYMPELADIELIPESRTFLLDMCITHNKYASEMLIDKVNRKIMYETLIYKYRYTKLDPYVRMVEAYKEQVKE